MRSVLFAVKKHRYLSSQIPTDLFFVRNTLGLPGSIKIGRPNRKFHARSRPGLLDRAVANLRLVLVFVMLPRLKDSNRSALFRFATCNNGGLRNVRDLSPSRHSFVRAGSHLRNQTT